MTDYAGASSTATTVWAGEGYSAFASATATRDELVIAFMDSDNNKKYSFTLGNPRTGDPYPTTHPTEAVAPIRPSAYVSQKIVIVSSGFAALAFLLIAGGFYYESKGRKKKRKAKKAAKGFMSYTLPGATSFTKTAKKPSKTKNSLRALATTRVPRNMEEDMMELVTSKKDFSAVDISEERARDTNDATSGHNQQSRSIVLGTNTSSEATSFISTSAKRFNIEYPSTTKIGTNNNDSNTNNDVDDGHHRRSQAANAAPAWDEERSQNVPHTIITHLTSSTPIGVQRSKDGRIFEAIPDARNEHHKRARTSIF